MRSFRPFRVLLLAAMLASASMALATCGGAAGPTAAPSTSYGWHRVAIPAEGYVLDDVVPDGSGVIAVGRGGTNGPGISWTSPDGSTWSEGPAADALATIPLSAVAATSSGLVALGADCSGTRCGFGNVKVVHASPGNPWSVGTDVECSQPNTPLLQIGTDSGETRIAAAGPGLVAVGFGSGEDLSGGAEGVPVTIACVWASTNGERWLAVPYGSAFDKAEMLSVVYAQGEYVAVGSVQTATGTDASVWISPDGQGWTREPDGSAFADGAMESLVAGGPGFVAVGTGSAGAAVWTSPDGMTWTLAPDAPSLDGAEMRAVAAGPGGLVAVGYDGSGAIVWHSTDGVTWTRDPSTPDFAEAQALSVAAIGDRFVAVGGASPAGTAQAYVWVGG